MPCIDGEKLRELFSYAVDEFERGVQIRLIERSLREGGLSHSKAIAFADLAKQVAAIFANFEH